jgi:putative ABC transport system permease protein
MSVWESVRIAFSSIKAHKMRSLLTMLGIIIGVGSVIVVVAIGQGGEEMLKSQLTGPGNTIEVVYQPSEEEIQSNPNIFLEPPFTQEDIRLLQSIPEVEQVVTASSEFGNVRFREETLEASITGVNEAYFNLNELNVEDGRAFTSADFLGGRRVALVGSSVEEELFGENSAVGEIIRIGVQPVEIVGVLEKPTGVFALGANEVYVPWNTWRTLYGKSDVSQVTLQAKDAESLQIAGEKAADLLNRAHQTEDSYQVFNMEALAEGIGQITGIMTAIIGSIAGISLLVGGIGVMNIMLVSVTERTREIGIRMAVGATRGQIMFQFLVEAMTLTLIGGIIGILLGWGAASLVSLFAGWPSLVSWYVVVGAVLFSMLIGVIFGLLPANKASRLDPIESLRYE